MFGDLFDMSLAGIKFVYHVNEYLIVLIVKNRAPHKRC